MRHAATALLLATLGLLPAGCRREPPGREYPITGHVLAVKADLTEVTMRHDDIPGFMPAMTMPFKVKDKALARGRQAGDLVKGTLVVTDEDAWLSRLEKTGWSPFEEPDDSARASVESIEAGQLVPDETFIDQEGNAFKLSGLRGSTVLLTFIYTRCPLPDFCPRMDRQFGAVQAALEGGRVNGPVRLVSISFDPDHDSPAVLREHAARVGANPSVWTFATAPRDRVDAFGARLGLDVIRDPKNPADITHNLRTAVIDPEGRLVTVFGSDWTPELALRALAPAAPR
jgi:protein SCO1/2